MLWLPCVADADIIFSFCGFFFLSIFLSFTSPIHSRRRLDMYHTSTRDVAQCKFGMQVWNVLHAARWKCRTQKSPKIAICAYHRTNLSGYIFATIRHVSIIGKKPVKQEYLLQMFPQYGELQPTEICLQVWGIPANFNGFRVLPSLLQRRHLLEGRPTKHCTMFGRLLRWHTIYIFGDSCPLTVFCPVQNSLYVQVPLSLE